VEYICLLKHYDWNVKYSIKETFMLICRLYKYICRYLSIENLVKWEKYY